jgi:hypothetical protein
MWSPEIFYERRWKIRFKNHHGKGFVSSDLIYEFKLKLKQHLKSDVELVINENRSTMLNVIRRRKEFPKLSMHKMFLKAPDEVISAIGRYIKGMRKENREENLRIRTFIQSNLEKLNYSKTLDTSKFVTQGKVYDLKKIYDEINAFYFNNELKLAITWYGATGRRNRSRIIFGQYFDHLHLVKIHRILDDLFFPPFFVSYVVYHEMLHHVVPGKIDAKGIFRTHGSEFKKRERLFAEYERAVSWEKRHHEDFFHGRS